MAKIYEEYLVVKISKLVKNDEAVPGPILSEETKAALGEMLAQTIGEVCDAGVVVELAKDGE